MVLISKRLGPGYSNVLLRPEWAPPGPPGGTLEDRVWRSLTALQEGLTQTASRGFDVLHAQDCIAGRAVVALRGAGVPVLAMRTVHHVDDFTTEALVECQRRSILAPTACSWSASTGAGACTTNSGSVQTW